MPHTEEKPDARDDELSDDLKDRISIMDINIENLKKNNIIYAGQKQKMIDQKQKLSERAENYRKDTYTDPDTINTKVNNLQERISKIDDNISAINAKINQTDNLLIRQKNMHKRLEKQLASSK